MRVLAVLVLTLLAGTSLCAAEDGVPVGARIALEAERTTYYLGETIHLRYRVRNTGSRTFEIDRGGDYRGASRHLRFLVEGVGENGVPVADPDPEPYCLGGISWRPKIAPGEHHDLELNLGRYLRLEEPGTYRVRVFHDLGWEGDWMEHEGERKPPTRDPRWATLTLELEIPLEAKANEILEAFFVAEAAGRTDDPVLDVHTLRHPAYLPALVRKAREGDPNAIAGISSIATPEATEALIGLLEAGVSPEVASVLAFRLPDPQLRGELPARHVFSDPRLKQRRFLVQRSWRSEFASRVRAIAQTWLATADIRDASHPAFMMEAVGEAEDLPLVTAALDRSVLGTLELPVETMIFPRPRGACRELLRAVRVLLRRGGSVPEAPETAGAIVTYLLALDERPTWRPEGWEERLGRWLDHDVPYVQESVLRFAPRPLPAPVTNGLGGLLRSSDLNVRMAALPAVRETEDPRFGDEVLRLLGRATFDHEIREAGWTARELGVGRYDLYRLWVDRLSEPGRLQLMFEQLQGLFEADGGYGWSGEAAPEEITRVQERWWAFLAEHRDAIRAGYRFPLDDPALTPDLWPTPFHWAPPPR